MTRASKPDDRRGPSAGPPRRAHAGWLSAPRPPSVGNRFAAWARALVERHGRAAERHGLLDLVLVRRPPFLLLLRQHRLTLSQWFGPRVNLSVQPLLRETVRREQPGASPLAPRAERQATTPTRQSPTLWPTVGSPVLLRLRTLFEQRQGGRAAASLRAGESPPSGAALREPRALTERAMRVETPLQLVFRRVAEAEQLARRGGPAASIETRAEMLLQRVVRQARRVEERSPGPASLVTRRPAAVPPVIEQRAAEFDAPAVAAQAPWGAGGPPGNIEQITDQVIRQLDRRLVATRERMGRF